MTLRHYVPSIGLLLLYSLYFYFIFEKKLSTGEFEPRLGRAYIDRPIVTHWCRQLCSL